MAETEGRRQEVKKRKAEGRKQKAESRKQSMVHNEKHTASLPDPCRVVSRAKGKSTRFCPGDFFWDRFESAQIVTKTVDG
jgi:hypothetical protein